MTLRASWAAVRRHAATTCHVVIPALSPATLSITPTCAAINNAIALSLVVTNATLFAERRAHATRARRTKQSTLTPSLLDLRRSHGSHSQAMSRRVMLLPSRPAMSTILRSRVRLVLEVQRCLTSMPLLKTCRPCRSAVETKVSVALLVSLVTPACLIEGIRCGGMYEKSNSYCKHEISREI